MNPITYNLLPEGIPEPPIYFHTASSYFPQQTMVYEKGDAEFYQILLVVSGTGMLHCDGKTIPLERGRAFFTVPGFPCRYENTGDLVTAFLTAKGHAIQQLLTHYGCGSFLYSERVDVDAFLSAIREIIKEYYAYKREGRLSALTYSFFIDYFELQTDSPITPLVQISLYIERNFSQKLTLEQLAAKYGFSVSKLCHDFKREYGCSIFTYILNLRLTYARNYLRSSRYIRTKDAALSCGFEDICYFCKAYKKKFGKSPSQEQMDYFGIRN